MSKTWRVAGIDFEHVNGASGRKFVIETVGPGGGFFDYDGDGRLDIYLVNGAAVPVGRARVRNELGPGRGSRNPSRDRLLNRSTSAPLPLPFTRRRGRLTRT